MLGVIGTLFFLFGIPNKIDEDGHCALILEQVDDSEIQKAKGYRMLSNLGLMFLCATYLLPLIATFLTYT